MLHLQEEKDKAKVYFYQPDNCTFTQMDENGKKYTNEKAL